MINFSAQPQAVTFEDTLHLDRYEDYLSGNAADFRASSRLTLEAWGYRVFVRRPDQVG